jgi:preprotein translocase subunit Sec63
MVTTDYDILDIKKGASQAEIQQAYESKMAAFDEAKIAAMGKSMQRDIAAKKQKIRQAYDNLSAAS